MSESEIARGRHSETEEMMSVVVRADGTLRARPAPDLDGATFLSDIPASARPPGLTGTWRHFKGGEYRFRALVEESPGGPLVLYEDASDRVWLRPRAMVEELVERDGRRQARFVRLRD